MEILSQDVRSFDDPLLRLERKLSEKAEFAVMPSEELITNYIPQHTSRKNHFVEVIIRESSFPVLKYILSHLDLRRINKILLTNSHNLSSHNLVRNIKFLTRVRNVRAIVDLKKVNQNENLNEYFSSINSILPDAGIYISCVETHRQRNKRIFTEKPPIAANLAIFGEFIFHRVISKIGLFRNFYKRHTQDKLPVISLAETLGRLVFSGFDIIEFKTIRNLTYFVVMKTREVRQSEKPLPRLILRKQYKGKNGKDRNKYSLRKNHIYSEYLPDYILHLNGAQTTFPVLKDFRQNLIGRMLHSYLIQSFSGSIQFLVTSIQELIKSIPVPRLLPKIDLDDIFYIKNSLGKGGKMIKIYKFRTMVRNAEQMDKMIIEYNSYGNPVNDPRITKLGRFMRKVWIDELPQLYSLVKRDINLVGIRPMRACDWERYPAELKNRALQFKPGLMGVQYGTLVKNDFKEHIRFFNSYLAQKEKKPFRTDLRFCFRILYYIFFKGVRSD